MDERGVGEEPGREPAARWGLRLIVAVDASLWAGSAFAGIAVVEIPTGKLLGAEIVETESVNAAEALAAVRACQFLAARSHHGSRIWTDALQVVLAVEGKRRVAGLEAIVEDLRAMLTAHGHTLEHRMRRDVKVAHNAARHVNKAFQAGVDRKPTWNRVPYVKPLVVPRLDH